MDVLIAEPDPGVAAFARSVLRSRGHRVEIVRTGAAALAELTSGPPRDQVVMAASLPDATGHEICRRLREEGVWTTVLMLVERDAPAERVRAAGADGYLRKPFSGAQLLAAMEDVSELGTPDVAISVGGLELDRARRTVRRADTEVPLSPIEFALLEVLAEHPGQVVDREVLVARAWSYEYENRSNVVDVYLRRLREKVDRPFGAGSIQTVRGRGYCLGTRDG